MNLPFSPEIVRAVRSSAVGLADLGLPSPLSIASTKGVRSSHARGVTSSLAATQLKDALLVTIPAMDSPWDLISAEEFELGAGGEGRPSVA